ncbi:MAG: hypothetical protein FD167_6020 [bacterium]|nr:MAG: hypothetical protein FD167_6020 [bacterium]TSC86707.1 MAG: hypothetical protein G01um10147_788 [Microgenomates group bacterium Gr01-1014_7]
MDKPVLQQIKKPQVKQPKRLKEIKLLSKRLERFLNAYIENGGNITAAAQVAHPKATRHSASVIGSRYMKQGKEFIRALIETKGLTYGKMIDVAEKKMNIAKDPAWWDRIMKMAGYADFMPVKEKAQTPSILNIIQTQKKLIAEYVEGDVEGEYIDE